MVDISIIIPIYNSSKYLTKCLDSIYSLDLHNKEVILINDGSTDNSLKIAKQYKENYSENTILISQENKGSSAARNIGLKIAQGEYIFFLDSDDFIETKSLEKFFVEGILKKQQILIGNYYEYLNKNDCRKRKYSDNFLELRDKSGIYFLEKGMEKGYFTIVVWRNLYKRSFLVENNLLFKEGLIHEDQLFTLMVFSLATSVGYSKEFFYYYRQDNLGSITRTVTKKNYIHMLYAIQEILEFQKNIGKQNRYINRIVIGMYWIALKNGKLKNTELFKKLKKLDLNFKEKLKMILICIVAFFREENSIIEL